MEFSVTEPSKMNKEEYIEKYKTLLVKFEELRRFL